MPERVGNLDVPLTAFGRMQFEQPLGKKVNLLYDAAVDAEQLASESLFEVRGRDIDASQLCVTLCSPLAIPRTVAELGIDLQNQSGEFSNAQIGNANYPGLATPIVWPPFVARLKWGVGGAAAVVDVDFVNGTVINVPASSLDVTCLAPADAFNKPGTTGLYTLSAFLAPGWPRPGNAQRTVFIGNLAASVESDVFAVPAFATRGTVIGMDNSPPPAIPAVTVAYIRFWQRPDGTGNVGNYIVNGNQPLPFQVPNAGQYFTIVSGMGITVSYAACFELAV